MELPKYFAMFLVLLIFTGCKARDENLPKRTPTISRIAQENPQKNQDANLIKSKTSSNSLNLVFHSGESGDLSSYEIENFDFKNISDQVNLRALSFFPVSKVTEKKLLQINSFRNSLEIKQYYFDAQTIVDSNNNKVAPGSYSFVLSNFSQGLLIGSKQNLKKLIDEFPLTLNVGVFGDLTIDSNASVTLLEVGKADSCFQVSCQKNLGLYLKEILNTSSDQKNLELTSGSILSKIDFYEGRATPSGSSVKKSSQGIDLPSKQVSVSSLIRQFEGRSNPAAGAAVAKKLDPNQINWKMLKDVDLSEAARNNRVLELGDGVRIEFGQKLGEGNFASAYLAVLKKNGFDDQRIAVKAFSNDSGEALEAMKNIRAIEADLMDSPHFSRVYSGGNSKGYAMELGGEDLGKVHAQLLREGDLKRYSAESKADFNDIALGLVFASERNIQVTDLKPDNILRALPGETTRVKFIDNDLTIKVEEKGQLPDELAISHGYFPPERSSGVHGDLDVEKQLDDLDPLWRNTNMAEASNVYTMAAMIIESRSGRKMSNYYDAYSGTTSVYASFLPLSVRGQQERMSQEFSQWMKKVAFNERSQEDLLDDLLIKSLDIRPSNRPSMAELQRAIKEINEDRWLLKSEGGKMLADVNIPDGPAKNASQESEGLVALFSRLNSSGKSSDESGSLAYSRSGTNPGVNSGTTYYSGSMIFTDN